MMNLEIRGNKSISGTGIKWLAALLGELKKDCRLNFKEQHPKILAQNEETENYPS
jgi:hypothetical protein